MEKGTGFLHVFQEKYQIVLRLLYVNLWKDFLHWQIETQNTKEEGLNKERRKKRDRWDKKDGKRGKIGKQRRKIKDSMEGGNKEKRKDRRMVALQ